MKNLDDRFDPTDLDDFEEPLADRPRDETWELIGGRVVKMMTGARWEHHVIVQNINVALSRHLRAQESVCRISTEALRLKERSLGTSVRPDVMVHCGPLPPGASSLDAPTVLVEVMSDGSIGRDCGEKWQVARKLPSLQHHVLVEPDKPVTEDFRVEGLDATLDLSALDLSIPLAEIYRDVLKP